MGLVKGMQFSHSKNARLLNFNEATSVIAIKNKAMKFLYIIFTGCRRAVGVLAHQPR